MDTITLQQSLKEQIKGLLEGMTNNRGGDSLELFANGLAGIITETMDTFVKSGKVTFDPGKITGGVTTPTGPGSLMTDEALGVRAIEGKIS